MSLDLLRGSIFNHLEILDIPGEYRKKVSSFGERMWTAPGELSIRASCSRISKHRFFRMEVFMLNLQELKSAPDPRKIIFKNHGLTLSMISKFVGSNYHHLSRVLSGTLPVSKNIDSKLNELVEIIREKEVDHEC